jgi:hypothetical protein
MIALARANRTIVTILLERNAIRKIESEDLHDQSSKRY